MGHESRVSFHHHKQDYHHLFVQIIGRGKIKIIHDGRESSWLKCFHNSSHWQSYTLTSKIEWLQHILSSSAGKHVFNLKQVSSYLRGRLGLMLLSRTDMHWFTVVLMREIAVWRKTTTCIVPQYQFHFWSILKIHVVTSAPKLSARPQWIAFKRHESIYKCGEWVKDGSYFC